MAVIKMDYRSVCLFLLTVILQFQELLAGSSCYERQYNYFTSSYYYTYYNYCTFGCCGYTTYRTCCTSYYYDYDYSAVSVSIGVIIGSVIGGLIFLGVMISVVICCICKCTERSRGQRGAVVAPGTTGGTGVSIVNSHVNMPMQPQPYYQMQPLPAVQPPPYNNIGNSQYSSAAYPPPPPAYPPPAYPPTAPPQQPGQASTPFSQPGNSQSMGNSAPPATTHK